MAPQKKKNTIYVQIAAYRDPELLNTLRDLLDKSDHPENLRIAIGWQHSPYEEWDNLHEYKNDPRFHIIDIDYRDARGPCWVRHKLNKAYKNEKYTMQLDSHHRFEKGWDTIVIEMLEGLRSKTCPKPLLSSYVPSFDPKNDPDGRLHSPWIMEFDRFAPEGPIHFQPHTIDNFKELNKPVPSRFMSGHFIFTDGKFCKEVEYDANYYFHGEEINLSVRSYMAGYDLFAPHRVFVWHEYTRNGKKKHWDDHSNWNELEQNSHKHNKELFGIDGVKSTNTINKIKRTLRDYEKYAGVEFGTRRVHIKTLEKKLPPVTNNDIEFKNGLTFFHKICIDIHKPIFTENDYNVWAIALENEEGKEIHRSDANKDEILQLLSVPYENDKFIHLWRNFVSNERPVKWIVWPHSESKGWQVRLTGDIRYV